MSISTDLNTGVPIEPKRKRRFFGLSTLILLIAAIAVWFSVHVNRRRIDALKIRIAQFSEPAPELDIADPAKIAVLKHAQQGSNLHDWDVYLPKGRYRLRLATRAIVERVLSAEAKSVSIDSGRHHVSLERESDGKKHRITLACDGKTVLVVEESKEWYPERGSSSDNNFDRSEQLGADRPVVLYRERFMKPTSPGVSQWTPEPTEGMLLWIEQER
jgi:hypothetical protein